MAKYASFPSLVGTYEVDRYRGNAAAAADKGVERQKLIDEVGEPIVHSFAGVRVEPGAPFVRRVHSWDDIAGDFTGTPEPWRLMSEADYQQGVISVPNRDRSSNPGDPMKDPLGAPIFVDVGDRPNTPASGEQARDEWTGALKFEEDGVTPIMVP